MAAKTKPWPDFPHPVKMMLAGGRWAAYERGYERSMHCCTAFAHNDQCYFIVYGQGD